MLARTPTLSVLSRTPKAIPVPPMPDLPARGCALPPSPPSRFPGLLTLPTSDAGAEGDPLDSLVISVRVNEDCLEYVRAASADARWQAQFCDAGTDCGHTSVFSQTTDSGLLVWLTRVAPNTYKVTGNLEMPGGLADASGAMASVTFTMPPTTNAKTSSDDCGPNASWGDCCGPMASCSVALPAPGGA